MEATLPREPAVPIEPIVTLPERAAPPEHAAPPEPPPPPAPPRKRLQLLVDAVLPEDERPPGIAMQIVHAGTYGNKNPKVYRLTAAEADELAHRLRRAAAHLRAALKVRDLALALADQQLEEEP